MKCKACDGKGKFDINEKGVQYTNTCYLCDGIGDIVICQSCNGQGEFISEYRFTPCMVCRGNGYSPKVIYDCKLCEGDGIVYSIRPHPYLEDIEVDKDRCDCAARELMEDERGNRTDYFYEIHNVRRRFNGL
tara:strand:+ start:185 stop:580 length:396 start_codon:yes stop_codon:yes gene_type:complete